MNNIQKSLERLPIITGVFGLKKNRDKILAWIDFFVQQDAVLRISVPSYLLKETKGEKVDTYRPNKKFNFFHTNEIYMMVEIEKNGIFFRVYLFNENMVEVIYKCPQGRNRKKEWLSKNFNKRIQGWENAFSKILKPEEKKNIINQMHIFI
ncbi:MAG: hypothetical protein GXP45_01880 [bacterium]|nr:hypothetical protein [bacterium]